MALKKEDFLKIEVFPKIVVFLNYVFIPKKPKTGWNEFLAKINIKCYKLKNENSFDKILGTKVI